MRLKILKYTAVRWPFSPEIGSVVPLCEVTGTSLRLGRPQGAGHLALGLRDLLAAGRGAALRPLVPDREQQPGRRLRGQPQPGARDEA